MLRRFGDEVIRGAMEAGVSLHSVYLTYIKIETIVPLLWLIIEAHSYHNHTLIKISILYSLLHESGVPRRTVPGKSPLTKNIGRVL